MAIIRLPHISNYTDFDPLEQEPGVRVHYLDHHNGLENLDLVILPGTKNTIADLLYLQRTGLAAKIRDFADHGGRVVGICGGFQMLGQVVRDPSGGGGSRAGGGGFGTVAHCHHHGRERRPPPRWRQDFWGWKMSRL